MEAVKWSPHTCSPLLGLVALCKLSPVLSDSGDAQIDIAVKTKLRPARNASQLRTMSDCHSSLELGCKAATSQAVKQVLTR